MRWAPWEWGDTDDEEKVVGKMKMFPRANARARGLILLTMRLKLCIRSIRAVSVRETEVKNVLGLLKITIRRYPSVFESGGGASAVRVFAHVFVLTAVSNMRCVHREIESYRRRERLTMVCLFTFSRAQVRRFTNSYTPF